MEHLDHPPPPAPPPPKKSRMKNAAVFSSLDFAIFFLGGGEGGKEGLFHVILSEIVDPSVPSTFSLSLPTLRLHLLYRLGQSYSYKEETRTL